MSGLRTKFANAARASVFVICFAAIASAQTATEPAVQLRWDFQQGQTYKVEMNQEMVQSMDIHGQSMKTSNDSTTFMTWKVGEVDGDGNAKITTTIDRMKMEMEIPMAGKVEYDSDNAEAAEGQAKMFADMFAPMIGKPMGQSMNQRGEVSEVQIPEGIFGGMQANPMMGQMMSEKQIAEMIKKASPVFPAEAIQPGKKWTIESTMETPVGKMNMKNDYVYKGPATVDGVELQQVNVNSTMDFEPGPNAMGMKIGIDEQLIEGSIFFDTKTGMMHSSQVEQTMNMNLEGQGQTLQQKMKQVMKATFKRA